MTDTYAPITRIDAAVLENSTNTSPPIFEATPYRLRDAAEIRRREWLYGRHYICGFVSTTIARTGTGKTACLIAEMLAMVTARDFMGAAPERPLRVWYIGEDPMDEIDLRVTAACLKYEITAEDIGGRLFVDSVLNMPTEIKIAKMQGAKGIVINKRAVEAFKAMIRQHQIDVLILDPLIKFHGVPENDNGAMEVVMIQFCQIAHEARVAIELPHHIRKPPAGGREAATVDDGRGATAIISAARSARVLNSMSAVDADKAGIMEGDRWRYLRIDLAKSNMAPPEAAKWHQLASEILPCGESVGVCSSWKFPDAFASVTSSDLTFVRGLARTGAYRSSSLSPEWIGKPIAEHFQLDLESKPDRAKVKTMLKTWLKNKVLDVEKRDDAQRRQREYVVPGAWNEINGHAVDDFNLQ